MWLLPKRSKSISSPLQRTSLSIRTSRWYNVRIPNKYMKNACKFRAMMYLSLLQNKTPALSSTLEFSLPPGWRKPGTGKFPLQTKLSDVKSSSLRWGLFISQTSQTFQESALLMVGLRKPGPYPCFVAGPSWHTAQWDHSVSLAGKKVV